MNRPVGIPWLVPTQQMGRLGFDFVQSAASSQGMFMGLIPEHVPFGTQRSGNTDCGSRAPDSAQHTSDVGLHLIAPQKMPPIAASVAPPTPPPPTPPTPPAPPWPEL